VGQADRALVAAAMDAFAGDPVHVVASLPAEGDGVVRRRGNVTLARFVPHSLVLDRAVCVVTHGGMGVTQKALDRGIPVSAVPFGRDQFEVARRIEVARAVARMRGLAPTRGDHFDDVGAGRNVVNTLAEAGVIEGCAPRRFCPSAPVTRAQAASLLVRALPGLNPVGGRRFSDLPGGYVHTPAINALAADRITRGCAPRRFCPARRMTRGQLASLLVRALDR